MAQITLPLRVTCLPKKLWTDYIYQRFIDEEIIRGESDLKSRIARDNNNVASIDYKLELPHYDVNLEIKVNNKSRFLREVFHYEEKATGDDFWLDIGGDESTYHFCSLGLDESAHKFLGDGAKVNTRQWADQFIGILARNLRANRK